MRVMATLHRAGDSWGPIPAPRVCLYVWRRLGNARVKRKSDHGGDVSCVECELSGTPVVVAAYGKGCQWLVRQW